MKPYTIKHHEGMLRSVSRDTTIEEIKELEILSKIEEALKETWTSGCGLAAVQVGHPLRFAWFHYSGEEFVLLNPEIIKHGRTKKTKREGCMSIPQRWVNVRRSYKITVRSAGVVYKFRGQAARIVQHEVDHMNGVLITDHE